MELIVLAIIVAAFIGYSFGWHRGAKFATFTIMTDAHKRIQQKLVKIKVEKHEDGSLRAYREETGLFLAQGSSQPDLNKALDVTLPGSIFLIEEENAKNIGWELPTISKGNRS